MKKLFCIFLVLASFTSSTKLKSDEFNDKINELNQLIWAIDLQIRNFDKESGNLFLNLYQVSGYEAYLAEYFAVQNKIGNPDIVIEESKNNNYSYEKIIHEIAKAYYITGDFINSEKYLLKLNNPTIKDYKLLGMVYIKLDKLDLAAYFFKKVYEISNKAEDYIELVRIYIAQNKLDIAIKMLHDYMDNHDFNLLIEKTLAVIYAFQNDYNSAYEIYRAIYNHTLDPFDALNVLTTLKNLGNIWEMIDFLEDSGINNTLLLNLYLQQSELQKGLKLSDKLYKETHDNSYLAQYVIFQAEIATQNKKRLSKEVLKNITSTLEKIVDELNSSLYYNYLGYLLIDYDYKVEEGLKYIQKALKLENDPFILDSLAWGQFKLNQCDEAYKNMKQVVRQLGTSEPEIKEHWEKIQKCKEQGK